jgi:putative membrane protein
MLNATGTVFLVSGWLAIRRGNQALHMRCMITAFALAIAFLGSYLARYSLTGSHRYPGDGADKVAYLVVLASHSALAAIAMPMAAVVVYLAWRRRFAAHRRLARWTWPIWLYVSVTGVVVYLMLYPLADALHGP